MGTVSSLKRPTLQSVKSYPPEVPETDITKLNFYKHPLQGTVVSSLPAYRRIGTIAQRNEGAQIICAMPAATWRRLYCQDAWNLVVRCILHACGQSCWKYTKAGRPPTCRHGMFHVVLCKEANVKGRRPGKKLRNIIRVVAEDEGGLLGRLDLFQEHPFDGAYELHRIGLCTVQLGFTGPPTCADVVCAIRDAWDRRSTGLVLDERWGNSAESA